MLLLQPRIQASRLERDFQGAIEESAEVNKETTSGLKGTRRKSHYELKVTFDLVLTSTGRV